MVSDILNALGAAGGILAAVFGYLSLRGMREDRQTVVSLDLSDWSDIGLGWSIARVALEASYPTRNARRPVAIEIEKPKLAFPISEADGTIYAHNGDASLISGDTLPVARPKRIELRQFSALSDHDRFSFFLVIPSTALESSSSTLLARIYVSRMDRSTKLKQITIKRTLSDRKQSVPA